jgi:adenylate cyclase
MSNSENRTIEKLNIFIDENLDNSSLSLDTLYKEIGISRTQLHRIVKDNTQLPITLYIRKRRLNRAKTLLTNTDIRISEAADAVGISSPQNFSKYFVEEFNISPSEFRKQFQFTQTSTTLPTEAASHSIAVLPFVNMSADLEQDYFSDGISEEIINMLTQIQRLKVSGRTSSFAFKGQNLDLRQIGKQLNVNHILEGSVRKSGNKLRITAQLIKVEDGYHVWSEKFDRNLEDIFDIQDEISLKILNEVKIQLFEEEKVSVLKRYTDNPQAYQLYLHGRFYHNKFAGLEEFTKAIKYFRAAIALEPDYALAYSGIASCYLNLWFYRHLTSEESLPLVKEATEKSLQLDDKLVESHFAIARMKWFYEWDFKGAEIAFQKALSFNANIAEVNGQYALFLALSGKHTQAKQHALLSLNTDPFSLVNNFYTGYVYWLAGDFDKAIEQGRNLVELEPNFWGGHILIGFNLIAFKKYDEALQSLEMALFLNLSGIALSACGVLFALSGQPEKAREIIRQMDFLNKTQPVYEYDFGIVYACLGEMDTARAYFEKATQKHEPSMLFFKYIIRDWFADYQNDSRYLEIVEQIAGG